MLAKQARKIQASECGANMLLLAARRTVVVGSASSITDAPVVFFGARPEPAWRSWGGCCWGAAGVRYS